MNSWISHIYSVFCSTSIPTRWTGCLSIGELPQQYFVGAQFNSRVERNVTEWSFICHGTMGWHSQSSNPDHEISEDDDEKQNIRALRKFFSLRCESKILTSRFIRAMVDKTKHTKKNQNATLGNAFSGLFVFWFSSPIVSINVAPKSISPIIIANTRNKECASVWNPDCNRQASKQYTRTSFVNLVIPRRYYLALQGH